MFADKEIAICLWDLKEFQYGFGLYSLVLFFKLIHKPQVGESKRKDLYPNALTQEQFNWVSIVSTFYYFWTSFGEFKQSGKD